MKSCDLSGVGKEPCGLNRLNKQAGATLVESSLLITLILLTSISSLAVAGKKVDQSMQRASKAFHLIQSPHASTLGDSDADNPLLNK